MEIKVLDNAAKKIYRGVTNHSAEILLGVGIGGYITTTVMAVSATPKALQLIGDAEKHYKRELTKKETVKVAYKIYIPSFFMGLLSTGCLLASGSVNAKRNAAIMTACSISEAALKEYQNKVIEVIGETKEKQVRDTIAEEHIKNDPISNKKEVFITGGETLCYDMWSGRYFKSDIDKIKRIENELNRQMLQDDYVSLNDLYFMLGLNSIPMGDELGWNSSQGLVELYFSPQLTDKDEPCLAIGHRLPPTYDYRR